MHPQHGFFGPPGWENGAGFPHPPHQSHPPPGFGWYNGNRHFQEFDPNPLHPHPHAAAGWSTPLGTHSPHTPRAYKHPFQAIQRPQRPPAELFIPLDSPPTKGKRKRPNESNVMLEPPPQRQKMGGPGFNGRNKASKIVPMLQQKLSPMTKTSHGNRPTIPPRGRAAIFTNAKGVNTSCSSGTSSAPHVTTPPTHNGARPPKPANVECLNGIPPPPRNGGIKNDGSKWSPPWVKKDYTSVSDKIEERLHEELKDFEIYCTLTHQERDLRNTLVRNVQNLAEEIYYTWPCRPSVTIFGSFATGLSLPLSDIDLVVLGNYEECSANLCVNLLRPLFRRLKRSKNAQKVLFITRAKVPIIKFRDKQTQVEVDISFGSVSGLSSSTRVTDYVKELQYLRPLIYYLKFLLSVQDLNDTHDGGIGSFLLYLMVTWFLKYAGSHHQNLGSALIGFLEYFGHKHDYKNHGLTLNGTGGTNKVDVDHAKGIFDKTKLPRHGFGESLCVKSPLEERYVGHATRQLKKIRVLFQKFHEFLTQNPGDHLLCQFTCGLDPRKPAPAPVRKMVTKKAIKMFLPSTFVKLSGDPKKLQELGPYHVVNRPFTPTVAEVRQPPISRVSLDTPSPNVFDDICQPENSLSSALELLSAPKTPPTAMTPLALAKAAVSKKLTASKKLVASKTPAMSVTPAAPVTPATTMTPVSQVSSRAAVTPTEPAEPRLPTTANSHPSRIRPREIFEPHLRPAKKSKIFIDLTGSPNSATTTISSPATTSSNVVVTSHSKAVVTMQKAEGKVCASVDKVTGVMLYWCSYNKDKTCRKKRSEAGFVVAHIEAKHKYELKNGI